ncbi:hypothetical protein M430DRAFT_170260 [Amorphotheca resinae ATCC 22711]|uniref:Uncharacterized protein n=1 Tax=Amorphotheca resinae ATCC 22711 TaxID=857342 RepID=A0A2T3AUN3_AMORE|nr:hypothetical protein M430DRAFT_170260 [Amorphotheca resinae ATCC 22711]PSS12389.1 hypothetical protein M430DRAFT_170260 [Amorphotheca resinae ATCC 22711]
MRSTRKNGEASDRLHQRQMRTVGSCLVVTLPYLTFCPIKAFTSHGRFPCWPGHEKFARPTSPSRP